MVVLCAMTLAAMALDALGIMATVQLWYTPSIAIEDLLGGAI